MERESDSDINSNWCVRYSHQKIGKGTGKLGNKKMSRGHPNYIFIKIGQNTEKSAEDLKWLAVTRNPVQNYQVTLMWKTLKGVKKKKIMILFTNPSAQVGYDSRSIF